MKFFVRLSIKNKITWAIIITAAGIGLFVLVFFPVRESKIAFNALRDKAYTTARVIASKIAPTVIINDYAELEKILREVAREQKLEYLTFIDKEGKILVSSHEQLSNELDIANSPKEFVKHNMLNIKVPVKVSLTQLGELALGISLHNLRATNIRNFLASLIVSIAMIVLGVVIGRFVGKNIVEPIEHLVSITERVRQGDFSVRAKIFNPSDELGALSTAVNEMIENLGKSMNDLSSTVDELNKDKEQIQKLLREIEHAAEALSRAVEEMSSTAERLARSSETTNAAAQETGVTAKELQKSSQNISKAAEEVKNETQQSKEIVMQGWNSMTKALDGMKKIEDAFGMVNSSIVELAGKAERVSQVINLIEQVANQTKLLALNAAIESAGAGEAGKRFSVVASEIKRLSENVSASASEVRDLIEDIVRSTEHTVKSTENALGAVSEGSELIRVTAEILAKIQDMMLHISEQIERTAVAASEQVEGNAQIVRAMDDLRRVTEEVAEISQQVHKGAQHLTDIAHKLRELVQAMGV